MLKGCAWYTLLYREQICCEAREIDYSWRTEPVQKQKGFGHLVRKFALEGDRECGSTGWLGRVKAA